MTIFNVPSADVAKEKEIFLSQESQFRSKDNGNFYNATNYFSYGIGNETELVLTYFNLGDQTKNGDTLAAGFKKIFNITTSKQYKKYQPKLIFGTNLLSMIHRNNFGNWSYGAIAFTIPQTKTRITSGASYADKSLFGKETASFIGGLEQEITPNLYLIGDWYSGNSNSMGVLATGLSYNYKNFFIISGGAQFSNSKRLARNGFLFSLSKKI